MKYESFLISNVGLQSRKNFHQILLAEECSCRSACDPRILRSSSFIVTTSTLVSKVSSMNLTYITGVEATRTLTDQ